ncbi:hypothetical protein KIPB_004227, partial [Kipferlia bialata]
PSTSYAKNRVVTRLRLTHALDNMAQELRDRWRQGAGEEKSPDAPGVLYDYVLGRLDTLYKGAETLHALIVSHEHALRHSRVRLREMRVGAETDAKRLVRDALRVIGEAGESLLQSTSEGHVTAPLVESARERVSVAVQGALGGMEGGGVRASTPLSVDTSVLDMVGQTLEACKAETQTLEKQASAHLADRHAREREAQADMYTALAGIKEMSLARVDAIERALADYPPIEREGEGEGEIDPLTPECASLTDTLSDTVHTLLERVTRGVGTTKDMDVSSTGVETRVTMGVGTRVESDPPDMPIPPVTDGVEDRAHTLAKGLGGVRQALEGVGEDAQERDREHALLEASVDRLERGVAACQRDVAAAVETKRQSTQALLERVEAIEREREDARRAREEGDVLPPCARVDAVSNGLDRVMRTLSPIASEAEGMAQTVDTTHISLHGVEADVARMQGVLDREEVRHREGAGCLDTLVPRVEGLVGEAGVVVESVDRHRGMVDALVERERVTACGVLSDCTATLTETTAQYAPLADTLARYRSEQEALASAVSTLQQTVDKAISDECEHGLEEVRGVVHQSQQVLSGLDTLVQRSETVGADVPRVGYRVERVERVVMGTQGDREREKAPSTPSTPSTPTSTTHYTPSGGVRSLVDETMSAPTVSEASVLVGTLSQTLVHRNSALDALSDRLDTVRQGLDEAKGGLGKFLSGIGTALSTLSESVEQAESRADLAVILSTEEDIQYYDSPRTRSKTPSFSSG